MLWSFVYASFLRLVELVVWMFRSEDAKEVDARRKASPGSWRLFAVSA